MKKTTATKSLTLKGRFAALLVAFAIMFCVPLPAFAAGAFDNPPSAPSAPSAPTAPGSSAIASSSAERNAGNLFAIMHPVSNADIENDLYWAGQKLDANKVNVGTSGHGSILAAGQEITLANVTVADSVRAAAQDISISHAQVANNITIAARDISLGNEVSANGLYAAAETLSVAGSYKGGSLSGQNVSFDGAVEGDLSIAAESIAIGKDAQVTGTLTVSEGVTVDIAEGANVPNIAYSAPIQTPEPGPLDNALTILYACMAHIVLVGLFFLIIRKSLVRAANMAREQLVKMLLVGLVIFIVAPILCLALIFPLITIPIVVLMVLVMVIIALFSLPFAGSALGLMLLGKRMNPVLAAVIGTVVLTIFAYIPILSVLTVIFCIMFTAGYLWMCYWETHQERKQERIAARQAALAAQPPFPANGTVQPGATVPPPPIPPNPGDVVPPAGPSDGASAPSPETPSQPPAPTGDPVEPAAPGSDQADSTNKDHPRS